MTEDDEDICPRCGELLDSESDDPDEGVDPYLDVHERCITGDELQQRLDVLVKMLRDKQAEAE